MDWLQISLELPTTDGDIESLETLLLDLGASAVSLTNATDTQLFEPLPGETPLWSRSWVTGLFPADIEPAHVLFGVQAQLGMDQPPRYRVEALADQDWIRAGLANLKPMPFGSRLWVCPSGHEIHKAGAIVMQLDPGLAFGTGTHPSTALCLEALDASELSGCSVIDYGCGSGILAVAAALLGASQVTAVDIDPQALLATGDNAQRNHVQDRIVVMTPDRFSPHPMDLLVANILSGPLQSLAPVFARCVKAGGRLVLAGLLETDADRIRQSYQPWFDLPQATVRDGWLCLAGTRHAQVQPS